jgi:hypothetical protein
MLHRRVIPAEASLHTAATATGGARFEMAFTGDGHNRRWSSIERAHVLRIATDAMEAMERAVPTLRAAARL